MYIILNVIFHFLATRKYGNVNYPVLMHVMTFKKKIRQISSVSDIIIRALNFTRKICTFVLEV